MTVGPRGRSVWVIAILGWVSPSRLHAHHCSAHSRRGRFLGRSRLLTAVQRKQTRGATLFGSTVTTLRRAAESWQIYFLRKRNAEARDTPYDGYPR